MLIRRYPSAIFSTAFVLSLADAGQSEAQQQAPETIVVTAERIQADLDAAPSRLVP
jgi:hypothetical protein